jgi:hypothetical protein
VSLKPVPNAALELERRKALTQRVRVGGYYSYGEQLAVVVKVYELGHVMLRDLRTGEWIGCGIDSFRREWWLVKGPAESEAA